MADDILHRVKKDSNDEHLILTDDQLQNYTLFELENLLNQNNRSLKEFPDLPFPDMSFLPQVQHKLIWDELQYGQNEMHLHFQHSESALNHEQKTVFDTIIDAVHTNSGGFYFVYGGGGTGKTYLYNSIMAKLRSENRIVLAVASSGIAALLFPGGRTAHSRFKIPLEADECSCCDIRKKSILADLIRCTDLIIWDEAPMTHRHDFEAVERTLTDLRGTNQDNTSTKIFGGITILLGGDFRQILPVVEKGTRESIVAASLNRSHIWNDCRVFKLTTNMRISSTSESASDFSKWILDLGEGKLPAISIHEGDELNWIKIPEDLLLDPGDNSIETIVNNVYPSLSRAHIDLHYFSERCISTQKNDCVDKVNAYVLSTFPGEMYEYLSADTVIPSSEKFEGSEMNYPADLLNKIQMSGLPNHVLQLKVGVPIMLMRNSDQSRGLCNGTRLIITRLGHRMMEGQIITGNKIGNIELIHRIVTTGRNKKWAFILRRTQFSVKLCFSMTINKSQGQTLQNVGVYLPRPVFTHGQLYVAVSRTTTRAGLEILINNNDDEPKGHTQNIVYYEIFNNLEQGLL